MLSQSVCHHVDSAVDSSIIGLHYEIARIQRGLDHWALYGCYQCTFAGTIGECKNHAVTSSHTFCKCLHPTLLEPRNSHFTVKSTLNYSIFCVQCDDIVYPNAALSYSLKRKSEESLDDDIESPSKRMCQRQGLRGMHNLGKTCYMNSMIQAMLHNPLLASFFLGNGHPNYACEVDDCIACSLTDTFESCWTSEDPAPYAPTKLLIASWKNGVVSLRPIRDTSQAVLTESRSSQGTPNMTPTNITSTSSTSYMRIPNVPLTARVNALSTKRATDLCTIYLTATPANIARSAGHLSVI